MNVIPTKIHGIIDYISGVFFCMSPWLFGFATDNADMWIPIILGVLAVVYSLFTDYEWGIIRRLPMPVHLTLDIMSGVLMAASPWIFGFADQVYLPHVIFGFFEIGAGLLTQRAPSYSH
jgi:hypothetical protein